jgi:alpha-1,2-glucosyltransferase
MVLRAVNEEVGLPYMDEPFHVGQAGAYCKGQWAEWDNKITTPPGTYLLSIAIRRIFLLKCNLQHLRFTVTLALITIPILLTRLVRIHQRVPPPRNLFEPTLDAVALATFPVLWFFGFLYYTDVPSVAFTLAAIIASRQESHYLATLVRPRIYPIQSH